VKPGTSNSPALALPADWRTVEALFDHVPDTVFFVKDAAGRYLAVNQSLVARCGLRHKSELIGRRPADVFPGDLGRTPTAQDARVLRTGRPLLNHLELHWYARGKPGWCLTTKLPLRDAAGKIIGLVGISRDLRAPGERDNIPTSLAATLEFLEEKFAGPISPAQLARRAGLSPVRFARLIKRIFRLTPSQLITQTRLAAAAQLLTDTDRSVADIALACGFYDHSAFTRAFRSATGRTPTEFRARRLQGTT
jgi:PAS domain S-box-containing protein